MDRLQRLKDLVERLEQLPASPDRDRVLAEVRSRAVDLDTGVTPRAMLPLREPTPPPPVRKPPPRPYRLAPPPRASGPRPWAAPLPGASGPRPSAAPLPRASGPRPSPAPLPRAIGPRPWAAGLRG